MRTVYKLLGFLVVLFWTMSILIEIFKSTEEKEALSLCEDYTEIDELTQDRMHYRNWDLIDYRATYCTNYLSYAELARQSEAKRNQIIPVNNEYAVYWGSIYDELVQENAAWVGFVADSLLHVARHDSLDAASLAELTVSFVQDIPYEFISSGDCGEASGHPCVALARFGILSPYEFLHTLSGDCDTRAVLLYALLMRMNFDPMIVVSQEYRHAMLALNISASGASITLGRKNYYFWETTATGWPVGMLPPDMQNLDYWQIALVNEL